MRTIEILSQKGGSGKTTLALHLAVAAERAGRVAAVIDLDPQASAAGWKDSRSTETPVVVAMPASRLSQALDTARGAGADLALIDSAPHAGDVALAAGGHDRRCQHRQGCGTMRCGLHPGISLEASVSDFFGRRQARSVVGGRRRRRNLHFGIVQRQAIRDATQG